MNIKTALKSAVVSLALAIASIPAFCVEPAVSYVPSDTSAVACINVSPLLKLGGKNGLFSDLLRGYFSSKIPSDLDSQIALFVFSGNRRAMIVSTNSKFDNESGIRDRLPKSTFVSNDRLQVIFTDDESVKKPDIFEENDSPSELVDSMDTEKSIVSVAMDMDAYFNLDQGTQKAMADIGVFLHCILTNNKQYMGHDGISNIVMSFVHTMQNIFFRKAKVLIFRIAPNSDGSLDMILTIRFKTEEAQTGFAEGFEKMKQMDASAFVDMIYNGQTMGPGAKGHEAEIEEHIQSMKDGIGKSAKSMEIEVSEDEIVITRKVSKDPDSVDDAFDGTIDLLSGILVHALMQNDARKKELGQGANRGNAPSAGGEPPDYEAMVPLEETPDPDEEGISDEEREERLKMREEALKRRQEKIAELEQNAAALEEQQRVAELNKEMFEYLQQEKWDLALDVIREGADVNAKDDKGRTPAFYCIEKGKYNILTSLEQSPDGSDRRKLDLEVQDNNGMSLLHCAVKNKQDAIITYLVRVRACSPRTQMKNGTSPLYDAAKTGTAEQVKLLITFGADVNAETNAGLTPLHQAAARGNLDMVKELVEAGAEVNAVAKDGRTPVFYAAARGKASTVSYLLDRKAEINLTDENGMTPLILAAGSGNAALVKFLVVNKKANFAAKAKDGTTALLAGAKYPEIVKFLAEKVPNVNGADKDGNTVLHLCAETADEETIRKLLFFNAKEDLANNKGETPIMLAAKAGNVDMVKRLLNMNVKVTKEIVDAAKTPEIKELLSKKLK